MIEQTALPEVSVLISEGYEPLLIAQRSYANLIHLV